MPLLTFAKFTAHHMYPRKPSQLSPALPTGQSTSAWAMEMLLEAGIYANANITRKRTLVPSHVRIQVKDEMVFWQHLTWLRHVGEARFGVHQGRLIGWIKISPKHQSILRSVPLRYLEITIAKYPQEAPYLINRLVMHEAQLASPITYPAQEYGGDIRHQPNHAETIFAALPPY